MSDLERVQRGVPATLVVTFYGDETPIDADGDAVNVTVKRADGSTLSSGSALHQGSAGSGQYKYTVPAQSSLNILEVTWTGNFSGQPTSLVTEVEIVGGFLFTVSELRSYDTALANPDRFPLSMVLDRRIEVEDEFEDICGRAFVARFNREVIQQTPAFLWEGQRSYGQPFLELEKPELQAITKLTVDGTDQLDWVTQKLVTRDRDDPYVLNLYGDALAMAYAEEIEIEYEYGMWRTPPVLKDKAKKRARGLLVGQTSRIDERATIMSIPDFGTFNLATPGQRGSHTGIPDIDEALSRYMIGNGGIR